MRRRAVAAGVSVALLSIIGVLGYRWRQASATLQAERANAEVQKATAQAQRIDKELVTVRDDLASERVEAALKRLQSLTAEGHRGPVEEVLKTTLSWISSLAELLKEIKPPHLFQTARRLFSSRQRKPPTGEDPVADSWRRRSGDARRRRRTRWPERLQIKLSGSAKSFETGSGLLIVTGRYSGGNNISFRESFWFCAQALVTVFSKHWDGPEKRYQYRFIQPLYVSSDCQSFRSGNGKLFLRGPETAPAATDMFFISADTNGLKPSPSPESIEGWKAARIFSTRAISSGSSVIKPAIDTVKLRLQSTGFRFCAARL